MNFYIDFEATQPENEIIAIGAISENGSTFYSLVKPQLSSISKYISDMIHVTAEDLEQANSIDVVLQQFDTWVMSQEVDIMQCRFISYGDDSKFIKATLPAITSARAFTVAALLMAKIEDCTAETKKFFHGSIRLIHAFNYVQSVETEQKHNPLEDAMMLQKVYEYTQINEPLPCHPLNKDFNEIVNYKSPSGTFFCRHTGKNQKEISFETCEEAIDWVIAKVIKAKEPEKIHRDRIMKNIMKAIRTNKPYCNFKWRRVKDA